MNEHAYFHWDLLRQPLQTSQFGMGAPFFDVNSILELRKEKSRDAARSRRGKENYEFYELAKLLPLPAAITSQLDKASIIRLTISYLKLRDFSCHGDPQWTQEGGPGVNKINKSHQSRLDLLDPFESRQGTHILQSLDGFAFILGSDGRFLYISETVSIYLGLSQVEMAGSSIFEYVHPQDHTELADQLGMCVVPIGSNRSPNGSGSEDGSSPAPRPCSPSEKGYMMVPNPDKSSHKSFSLRMKSTLTKRGVHVKTSGYRVIHILGSLRPQSAYGLSRSGGHNTSNNAPASTNNNNNNTEPPSLLGMVGMAVALPPPTVNELRLELDTFITKMSPDFKVIYCEPIVSDLMDLTVADITGRLLYDLCHAADLKNLRRSHLDILNKGQTLTDYYRVMNRHGGYIWVQTCATTLLNNKNSDEQSILAINFVVSGMESTNCALDLWQLTGDVSSLMSSSSNSQSREDKLKELRANKASTVTTTKGKAQSPSAKDVSSSPVVSDDVTKSESKTTGISSSSTPIEQFPEEAEASSPEKNAGNQDGKNKRRKMENPRKRKRSSCDPQETEQDDAALNLTRNEAKASVIAKTPQSMLNDSQNNDTIADGRGLATSGTGFNTDNVTSSSPEDLSIKRSGKGSTDRNIIQHSSNVFKNTSSLNVDKQKSTTFLNVGENLSSDHSCIAGSSVRELEAAMNRHLPASSSTSFSAHNERVSFDHLLVDSVGTVKGASGLTSSGLSTNAPPSSTPWLPTQRGSGSDMLTATNFLRTLYANRESVIKTNSRSQTSYLTNDPPTSLLTPPEPDPTTYRDPNSHSYSYGKTDYSGHSHLYDKETGLELRDQLYKDHINKDQYSFIPYKDHIPTSYIDHISSAVYKDHLASTYKELSPYKDIIPAFTIPSLMSPTGRMHQAYPSFHHHFTVPITTTPMDACSITPPSPNSPDVNKHTTTSHQYDTTNYTTDLTNICNLSQKQTLTNSLSASTTSLQSSLSHPYHHPRHHRDHFSQGVSGVDVTKSAGYYSVAAASTGPMYPEINQNITGPTQYEACTRQVLPWY